MLILLCRCQIRLINHASINIATSILGRRRWCNIWQIRWSPTRYWRILRIWICVLWRSGLLLTNQGQLRWINDWIIKWRRHRYQRWWQIIALWVTFLAIREPVITRSRSLPTLIVPCSTFWRLQIPFVRGMTNEIWVCGGVVCLLFFCLWPTKVESKCFGATTAVVFEFQHQE